MKYIKLVNGVVVQVQPNEQEGFIKCDDYVVCGMIQQGDEFVIKPKPQTEIDAELLAQEVADKKAYLLRTDFKFLNSYKPKPDEDLAVLEVQRDEAREFIRSNK